MAIPKHVLIMAIFVGFILVAGRAITRLLRSRMRLVKLQKLAREKQHKSKSPVRFRPVQRI